ncbi:hypothetical protein DFQ27_004998 [Actinomortierella ambigua]|uniref:Uncharacterized protein n=1 Tax=Actinomortierella ambigua TaxID=1343610 RepID=A0A9P6Q012_9FUNG|nr:hypothetical protein DFQ27_004998 [Actinomortierella ambigua]
MFFVSLATEHPVISYKGAKSIKKGSRRGWRSLDLCSPSFMPVGDHSKAPALRCVGEGLIPCDDTVLPIGSVKLPRQDQRVHSHNQSPPTLRVVVIMGLV